MKKIIILVGIVVMVVLGIYASNSDSRIIPEEIKGERVEKHILGRQIKIGEKSFNLEIADTDEERMRGLSFRSSLDTNSVLLFVFKEEGYPGIWMKDMNFSIDIIWLDKNKKIVHIEKNVSPDTYPNSFSPKEKSLYVIEFNSGVLDENEIKIGDLVQF